MKPQVPTQVMASRNVFFIDLELWPEVTSVVSTEVMFKGVPASN